MPTTDPDPRREVALFRFALIGPLLHLEDGSEERRQQLRRIVEREHEIPGSRRRRVARSTLCDWLRRYRANGFDALYPRYRVDREHSRSLPPAVVGLLTSIKEREPRLTVKAVIRQALDSGQVPEGVRLTHSTVNRLLKQAGLMQRPEGEPEPRDRRRFSWPLANDMWQTDVMHGPKRIFWLAARQTGVEGERRCPIAAPVTKEFDGLNRLLMRWLWGLLGRGRMFGGVGRPVAMGEGRRVTARRACGTRSER